HRHRKSVRSTPFARWPPSHADILSSSTRIRTRKTIRRRTWPDFRSTDTSDSCRIRATDMALKQPALGVTATIIVMAIALAFVSLFSFPTFSGWVAYFLLCVIPIQIVMAVTWGSAQPSAAANAPQPLRGLLLTLFALVVGAVVAALALKIVGAGVTPPAPILAH